MMRIPGSVIGAIIIGVPALIRGVREWGDRRRTQAAARLAEQQVSNTATEKRE